MGACVGSNRAGMSNVPHDVGREWLDNNNISLYHAYLSNIS